MRRLINIAAFYYFCINLKWQPIHYACECGHEELVHELIDKHGVNLHAEDQVRFVNVVINDHASLTMFYYTFDGN